MSGEIKIGGKNLMRYSGSSRNQPILIFVIFPFSPYP